MPCICPTPDQFLTLYVLLSITNCVSGDLLSTQGTPGGHLGPLVWPGNPQISGTNQHFCIKSSSQIIQVSLGGALSLLSTDWKFLSHQIFPRITGGFQHHKIEAASHPQVLTKPLAKLTIYI